MHGRMAEYPVNRGIGKPVEFKGLKSLLLVWQTFRLNARYGTYGLMKIAARKRHPRFIINRKAIPRLFTYKKRKETDQ